jgi:hypothetical protein
MPRVTIELSPRDHERLQRFSAALSEGYTPEIAVAFSVESLASFAVCEGLTVLASRWYRAQAEEAAGNSSGRLARYAVFGSDGRSFPFWATSVGHAEFLAIRAGVTPSKIVEAGHTPEVPRQQ